MSVHHNDRDSRIDLSPAKIRQQDHLLIETLREYGKLPDDHYWDVVFAYRENDLRQTGNDHRFARDHPWVADVLEAYEAEQRQQEQQQQLLGPPPGVASLSPPPNGPPIGATGIPVPPKQPTVAGVPEPSGAVLLGIALGLSWLVRSRRS